MFFVLCISAVKTSSDSKREAKVKAYGDIEKKKSDIEKYL